MVFLPGPAVPLADYQVDYAGLRLGPGTPYDCPPVWSFLDSPPVRQMDTARPWGDGSWSGEDFADTATWQWPVEIAADAGVSFPDAIAELMRAFTIAPAGRPLWVKLPGFPVRGLLAKTTQRSIPVDLGFDRGFLAGAVQVRSSWPVWQSLPRTVVLTPSTGAAALNYPLFAPFSGSTAVLDYGIATAAAYAGVLTNAGNTDAAPYTLVAGPTNGFQLTVDGRIVAYSAVLGVGDTVAVDWRTGRAYLSVSGSTPVDRTHLLTSRDFGVVPAGGTATVTFAGTAGTAAVTTADLWR